MTTKSKIVLARAEQRNLGAAGSAMNINALQWIDWIQ